MSELSCSQIHTHRWYKAYRCCAVTELLLQRDREVEGDTGIFLSLLMSFLNRTT